MEKRLRREKGEGSLIKRNGCRLWYASYYVAGRQVRKSTGTDVKQVALAKLRKFMGKSEAGEPEENKKLKYGDIRTGLLSNYVEKGNKSLHVLADGTEAIVGLRQLDAFCGYEAPQGDKPGNSGIAVVQITTDLTREFGRQRTEEGAGPAMVNRSLQCLRRMLNIAKEDNKIANVPKIRLLKEPPARKGFLEREKFNELVNALPVNLRMLVTLLYYCGVRLGEAEQIQWPQVDLKAGLIRLEEEQTKSGEQRIVPIPDVLLAMLKPVQSKAGRVFDSTNLRVEWERACAAVKLGTLEHKKSEAGWKYTKYKGLIVHDLRRSAIRNLRLAGVAENVAMKISGHRTRAVFERYNIVNTEDVAAAMRAVEKSVAPSANPTPPEQLAPATTRRMDYPCPETVEGYPIGTRKKFPGGCVVTLEPCRYLKCGYHWNVTWPGKLDEYGARIQMGVETLADAMEHIDYLKSRDQDSANLVQKAPRGTRKLLKT